MGNSENKLFLHFIVQQLGNRHNAHAHRIVRPIRKSLMTKLQKMQCTHFAVTCGNMLMKIEMRSRRVQETLCHKF